LGSRPRRERNENGVRRLMPMAGSLGEWVLRPPRGPWC
jgi:hypothetical protein